LELVAAVAALVAATLLPGPGDQAAASEVQVKVGSKSFTESVILGEIVAATVRSRGAHALHRRQLGGTQVLFQGLLAGEIDVYPEYTGTIAREILGRKGAGETENELRRALAAQGVVMGGHLGFNNTYVIGMRRAAAGHLGIRRISDLARHPSLRLAFSNEFMDRGDGWPGMRARYRLPHTDVRGVDHDLAYRGLAGGTIDATDLYATDAEAGAPDLQMLEDDLQYFPEYHVVLLSRADLATREPRAAAALTALEGRITERAMVSMNARAKLHKVDEETVAGDFLSVALGLRPPAAPEGWLARLARTTAEHLVLVALSLFAAILVALPLGVIAARRRRLGQILLGATGVLQTIPSLALLVFMIPLLGIGSPPAVVALFLYSLLPIVRNTHAGLTGIALPILESARALGLRPAARLRLVELPLASPAILAGVRTAAVINVGTATLGALIGAGGYGQPILTGIRLDDINLILQGAVPAALLAVIVERFFDGIEHFVVPRGLRLSSGTRRRRSNA
jgi:osmoprotectant transport system permease protein